MSDNVNRDSYIQLGDLIIFDDKHYLVCGDSTKKESYKYMENVATMTLTSPPYNVGANNYGSDLGKSKKYLSKQDDIKSDQEYVDMLSQIMDNALNNSKYVFWNIAHSSGNKISLIDFNSKYKEKYVDTMIWVKTTTLPVIEPNVLNSDFEYIYIYTNIEDNGKHIRIGKDFRGTLSNVIMQDRNMQNEYAKIHSALMPIKLAETIIKQFSNEGDTILDVFGGLGTTMMACIKNNRKCYLIEIEPLYCETIIERYLDFVVGKPNIKIIRNGETIPYEKVREMCKKDQYSLFDF